MQPLLSLCLPQPPRALMPPTPASAPPRADWLAQVAGRAPLSTLLQAPEGLTLLAPTDEALESAELQPGQWPAEPLQRWLLAHLTLANPHQTGVLPMLDGSLLRRAEAGPGWLDGADTPLRLLGRPVQRQGLRVQLVSRALTAPRQTVWQRVLADPSLARLALALSLTQLDRWLGLAGPFTLFAPSDDALDRAAARLGLSVAALWRDTERMRELLLHHIVPGRWASSELPWPGELRTLAGQALRLDALGRLHSGDLALPLASRSDQPCSNGVLHRLTAALLPPG